MTLPKVSRTSGTSQSTKDPQQKLVKLQAKVSDQTYGVLCAVAAARRITVGQLIDRETNKHLTPLLNVEGLLQEERHNAA